MGDVCGCGRERGGFVGMKAGTRVGVDGKSRDLGVEETDDGGEGGGGACEARDEDYGWVTGPAGRMNGPVGGKGEAVCANRYRGGCRCGGGGVDGIHFRRSFERLLR